MVPVIRPLLDERTGIEDRPKVLADWQGTIFEKATAFEQTTIRERNILLTRPSIDIIVRPGDARMQTLFFMRGGNASHLSHLAMVDLDLGVWKNCVASV